jgi:hypothetical protein
MDGVVQFAGASAQFSPDLSVKRAERIHPEASLWAQSPTLLPRQCAVFVLLKAVTDNAPQRFHLNKTQQFHHFALISLFDGRTLRGLTRKPKAIFQTPSYGGTAHNAEYKSDLTPVDGIPDHRLVVEQDFRISALSASSSPATIRSNVVLPRTGRTKQCDEFSDGTSRLISFNALKLPNDLFMFFKIILMFTPCLLLLIHDRFSTRPGT